MRYTQEQKAIFDFVRNGKHNGIIDAVAGSGKTTTIIEAANHLALGQRALFCAFNRSIRKEIQLRFHEKKNKYVTVKTIHALGYEILRNNSSREFTFNEQKSYKIVDEYITKNPDHTLNKLLKINGVPINPKEKYDQILKRKFVYRFKTRIVDMAAKFRLTLCSDDIEAFGDLCKHYGFFSGKKKHEKSFPQELALYHEATLTILRRGDDLAFEHSEIDFTDMLYLPWKWNILPNSSYDFMFIDECQDLSNAQIAVVLKYVHAKGRILSVGDPFQSIYGFAGADVKSYTRLMQLPKTTSLKLSYCFRCPTDIIYLAQEYREDITAFHEKKGTITTVQKDEIYDLAKNNQMIISRLRSNLMICAFQLLFRGKSIQVHEDDVKEILRNMRSTFTSEELKSPNIEASLRTAFNRNDYYINRNADNKQGSATTEFLKMELDLLQIKVQILEKISASNKQARNIYELIEILKSTLTVRTAAINLSTIHRAKGLENETVYILDYDQLPLQWEGIQPWESSQEDNLVYVALTRSKKNLYLVKSQSQLVEEPRSLYDDYGF